MAMSILAVLSAIFVMLLNQVRTSTEGSGVRLDARAIHREVQSRLRILFKSALAPNEVDPSVAWPDIGNTDTLVRFHAPANLLDDTVAFDPRTPNYPEFSLQFQAASRRLVLQLSDGSGPQQLLGRELDSFEANRLDEHSLEFTLISQDQVRGASGGTKTVEERSVNRVLLHTQ